jgi:lipid-A-disaccharide synthase-like uncharacterized protein
MLIQYGQALGDYLYDVFVAKFDFWLAFGLVAQLLFTARFLVQWISKPVIIVGQAAATIIYIRNIMLIVKHRGKASKTLDR